MFGWGSKGIYADTGDTSDINACERSNNGNLLAAGDDFGQVRLMKYPCLENHKYRKATGHSSHVTKTMFSFDDQMLVSTGGNDLAVLVWETGIGDGSAFKIAKPQKLGAAVIP